MKWSTTQLIALGGLAVVDLILVLSGGSISSATGIPLAGGIINNILDNSIIVLCLLLMNRFGTGLLFRLLLSILYLPFPLLGAPGFAPKILVAIVAGLIADILYRIFRKSKALAAFLIGGLPQIWIVYSVVQLGKLVGMPGVENTEKTLLNPLLLTGAVILGGMGGLLGLFIYNRIKDRNFALRIRQSSSN